MSQSLQQLAQLQQPQGGMQRIPFPVESYEHPSKPLSAKRLLNCFAEAAPNDARSQVALRTSPGLVYTETFGAGPFQAFNPTYPGGFYCVSGTKAFRKVDGVTTPLGDVGLPVDPALGEFHVMVTIAVSPFHVAICVPPRLYAATHTATTLTEVDTSAFPPSGGCNSITYIDGYFVGTQHGRGNIFFCSALNDPFTWDALDFASADTLISTLLRAITHKGELWLLGYAGGEVWYDTGDARFPFQRRSPGVVPFGFVPKSVQIIDKEVWWTARDGCVYRSNGYNAVRISTHAVESIIELTNPDYVTAVAYLQEGHTFYCLTLPQLGRTLCYDAATQKWHDRCSNPHGVGPWRALVAGRVGEFVFVGDAEGRLYVLDADGDTDNGNQILQQVTFPPLHATTRRAFCGRAELEMEAPPATDVLLSWSDDGGRTFTAGRVMSGAQAQAERRRLVSTRLGSFRQRVFKVETRGRVTLYAMDADATPGAS